MQVVSSCGSGVGGLGGGRIESCSKLRYKADIYCLSTVTAQFCANRPNPESKWWRCGIGFFDKNGNENLMVHLDSHNLLVGYLNAKAFVKVQFHLIWKNDSSPSVFNCLNRRMPDWCVPIASWKEPPIS